MQILFYAKEKRTPETVATLINVEDSFLNSLI